MPYFYYALGAGIVFGIAMAFHDSPTSTRERLALLFSIASGAAFAASIIFGVTSLIAG